MMNNNINPFNLPANSGFQPQPQFSAGHQPTTPFFPRSAPVTVQSALVSRGLMIKRDQNNHLMSRDGRKVHQAQQDNLQLANAISTPTQYSMFEPVIQRFKQIYANGVMDGGTASGLIEYSCVPFPRMTLLNILHAFEHSGIIYRNAEYQTGVYVQLNMKAKDFINKGFAHLHLADFLIKNRRPDELYYDICLIDPRDPSGAYSMDAIYKFNNTVHYVVLALNPRVLELPNQLSRLVRLADKLGGNMSVVVSPNVDTKATAITLNNATGPNTEIIKVVPYTQLWQLP